MAQLHRSVATLRIAGDDLNPSEITTLLGCKPSFEQTKGQIFIGEKTGRERMAKTGMWSLYATDYVPENIDGQISELLGRLREDLIVWKALSNRYKIDLFCGLFMEDSNEGLELSPLALKALGERGITLSLDIYDGVDHTPNDNDPCPCESGKVYNQCCKRDA